ncbi:DUF724 domain-containing protein 6 isoform X3 [Ipomoea triloba]|uniref:DUF724 domain-containing protein 6 isoform X3 n=1 Tax=Ipomoea triloba TaxID=35885 RepID=UPI00125CFA0A|nr:DUF724 domain-containing protein 6 isoform X3 [Ipomoea triloba]
MGGVAKQQKQLLAKGSQVEVCTDEEGFTGAWFEAVILDPNPLPPSSSPSSSTRSGSKKKNAKVYVEYVNLLSDEDGHKPLRELVDPDFIRPRPPSPSPSQTAKGFELYDVVDAFYKDGWWTGVVTRLLDSFRYTVTFQNPPDELEFGLSDLRFHRQWLNGKWVRPRKQKTAGLMFSVGKKVEVSFDRDDCQDAWFPSDIIEVSGNSSFLVEYRRLNDGNENELTTVTVDALHIRPCPPLLKNKNFNLLDKVDAYYDFGWWRGVVNKVLADNSYSVFFKHGKKERVLNHSELRPHMDWKDGKWYTSQDASVPPDCTIEEVDTCNDPNVIQSVVQPGSPVTDTTNETSREKMSCFLKSDGDRSEQPTISIKKPSNARVSPMKRKQRLELPKEGISTRSPSLSKFKQKTNECETPTEDIPSGFRNPTSKGTGPNVSTSVNADELPDQPSQGKRTRKRHKIDEQEGYMSSAQIKVGGATKLQVKGQQSSAQGKEGKEVGNAAECNETDLPIIIGLECIPPSVTKKPRRSYGKECSDPTGDQEQNLSNRTIDAIKESKEDTLTGQRKKRGRPPKKLLSTPCASPAGMGSSVPYDVDAKDTIKSQRGHRKSGGRIRKMALAKVSNQKNRATILKSEKHTLKRGKRKIIEVNIESQIPDSADTPGGKDAECIAVEKVIAEVPSNGFEDQPLSKWIEEMHPPTAVDGSRSQVRNVEQHSEAREKSKEIVVRNPAIGNGEVTPSSDLQSLPFVKNTLLWATIESMDVFQKIPQKPHFRPLEQSKDSSREGLAIGYMVTFSSIVDKACRLVFDDPRSTIDEMLDTLRDLESHGFDVEPVRGRLNEMLSFKDKQENLEGLLTETQGEIGKQNMEKAKIEEEVDDLKKHIAKLEKKLSQAMSRKGTKEDDIASLRHRMGEISEEIRNLRCDYEALTSKPF